VRNAASALELIEQGAELDLADERGWTPLMKAASSLAKYKAALATSVAVENRPRGMVLKNF
jgi:hypothetical protein